MSMLREVSVVAAFAATFGAALAQGGVGTGFERDDRPWNPANWALTVNSVGTDTVSSWVMEGGQPVNRVDRIPWQSHQFFPLPGATNQTGVPRDVSMTSEGESVLDVRWIGVGDPPPSVLIRITSFAWAGTKPLGTISINNGLDTPTDVDTPDPELFDIVLKQFGSVLRRIPLDANGHAEIRIPKFAQASATDLVAHAYADARTTEQMVADRTLEVVGVPDPTFTIGFHDAPVPNEQIDPRILKMDIGLICPGNGVEIPPPGSSAPYGMARAVFIAAPWGAWNGPTGAWDWTDVEMSHWTVGQVYRHYSGDEVVQMIRSGPITLNNAFHMIDQDQIPESGSVEVRIHAPWEFPVWTSDVEKSSDFGCVSGWVVRNPYGPVTITESSGYETSITWAVKVGLSGEALAKAHPLLRALSISGEYGQTASVTRTQSYSMTVNPGPNNLQFCIEKQNFWRHKTGFFLAYGDNGFLGIRDMQMDRWASATKEDAERNDHRYRLHWLPYP
ncbi:MAG: hypothetical protein M9921_09820 [Fimbriimonadaceae bacterium]|nr:hypothetical protein [Fimbriimonadaceae bacterium]